MTSKILVVTAPDDVLLDGIRILLLDLTPVQQQTVSTALLAFENSKFNVVNYVWKLGDSFDWMIDKKLKSDLIIFNADTDGTGELIVGYVAAQPNAHYFGNLKDLHKVNNRAIYSVEDIVALLDNTIKTYDK